MPHFCQLTLYRQRSDYARCFTQIQKSFESAIIIRHILSDTLGQKMVHKEKIILLACGTFNPPHPMHFRMFELARDHLHRSNRYEVIGGIMSPAHDSYAKPNVHIEDAKHRCNMIELSLRSSDWIRLSQWEVSQSQWISTLQVVEHHQQCMDDYNRVILDDDTPTWMPPSLNSRRPQNVKIKLLCGSDFFEAMTNVELWPVLDVQRIIQYHGIVVISRTELNLERMIFETDLFYEFKHNIEIVENYVLDGISSTAIRLLLKRGVSTKYILHDDVIEYIFKLKLYEINSSGSARTYQLRERRLDSLDVVNEKNGSSQIDSLVETQELDNSDIFDRKRKADSKAPSTAKVKK